jgi:hypothetical protein
MGLSIALLHYPMVNKRGEAVATSVTNFDIHDIARAARTYGVERYYIVTPIPMQQDFVRRIMRYWLEGFGAEFNPSREQAMSGVEVLPDLVAVGDAIARDRGGEPYWVMTSARAGDAVMSVAELRERLRASEAPVCLVFGTGHGLHPEIMELADAVLEPIHGPTDYNHLSVRAAVAIYLDRLFGRSGR